MPIPNVIQFTAGTPTVSSFKYMNFYLGVQDQDYGPTSRTGFWAGRTIDTGQYLFYLDKPTQGPSIYVPQNDDDAKSILLQFYGNQIPVEQQTTLSNILNALYGGLVRTDSIFLNKNYENIITDDLYISIDPSFYMCTVITGGTPGIIKNIALTQQNDVNYNNISNTALKISDNGGVLSFDGVTNRFNFFDLGFFNPHLRFSGDVTYEFFVRIKELTGTTVPIYYKSPIHEGTLSADSTNKLVYSYGNGTNSQTFQSTTTLTNNTWYHIVLVRDLTDTQKLYWYINGLEDKSESVTYSSAATSSESTTIFQNGFSGQEFALVDLGVLRIYGSALTATQVSQNFNAQKSRFGL
jgi:hypothetical protein